MNLPEEISRCPIKDVNNPRSVINITPSSVSNAIRYIPETVFAMGEKELKEHAKPTEIEERLRISFWNEYDRAQHTMKAMNLSNVYGGVCSQTHFLKNIVSNSFKLAYILTPPTDYQLRIEEMLNFSLDQVRDILAQPHVFPDGAPNPKMADVKVKIFESLLERVKGAVAQRVESKNLNVNVEAGRSVQKADVITSPDEIDKKIRELEADLNGDIIDVQTKSLDQEES